MPNATDDQLDMRRGRYFLQVVECGSVRGAAEVLGMDASAVSRAIGALEQDCGISLLARRGRGVVPTDAGEILVSYLRRQHRQKQQLLAQFDGIQKMERGHVDVVTGEGLLDWLMRGSLNSFMKEYAGITVDLSVASTDEIVRLVIEERAHIGLVFQPPRDERLRTHHACAQPIMAQVPASHPLTELGRPLMMADLLPYAGAALQRSFGVRQYVEAAELSEGVRLRNALITSSFSAVAHFVASGLGYTLGLQVALPAWLDRSRVRSLPMQSPLLSQGRIHVISRHGHMLPKAAATLLQRIVTDISQASFD